MRWKKKRSVWEGEGDGIGEGREEYSMGRKKRRGEEEKSIV